MNQTEQNLDAEMTEVEMVKDDLNGHSKKGGFNLRGPREGKKSGTNKPVDEKKLTLAKSLFGAKKGKR